MPKNAMGSATGDRPVVHPYRQIADELTAAILDGRYRPGDHLPTVRELADERGISVGTAKRVFEILQTSGLTYSGYFNGRRGVRVRSTERTDWYASDAIHPDRKKGRNAFAANAAKVKRTDSQRFTMLMRVPPAEIAHRLGVPPNTLLVERTTIQLLDGEPWGRERSWYPVDLAKAAGLDTPNNIEQGTIEQLKEYGFKETAYRDEVIDKLADAEDAADLDIVVGTPLLLLTRTGATADRITRVSQRVLLSGLSRLIWEQGPDSSLDVIRRQLAIPDDDDETAVPTEQDETSGAGQ